MIYKWYYYYFKLYFYFKIITHTHTHITFFFIFSQGNCTVFCIILRQPFNRDNRKYLFRIFHCLKL